MQRIIKIALPHGEFQEMVGDIFGPVAVTPTLKLGKTYRITHIETGWALTPPIGSKRKAISLARKMNSTPDTWTGLSTKKSTKRNKEAGKALKKLWIEVGLEPFWKTAS